MLDIQPWFSFSIPFFLFCFFMVAEPVGVQEKSKMQLHTQLGQGLLQVTHKLSLLPAQPSWWKLLQDKVTRKESVASIESLVLSYLVLASDKMLKSVQNLPC